MVHVEQTVFYTWRDIEIELLRNKSLWPNAWKNIEVFSSEMIIYVSEINEDIERINKDFLTSVFKTYYLRDENRIKIKDTRVSLDVIYEVVADEVIVDRDPLPLFKEYYYYNDNGEKQQEVSDLPGAKVVAFHSYKGGVGRTLSVISVAKEIIEQFKGKKKILIVDSDIEAPGLTWLSKSQNPNVSISYMDVLSIINSTGYNEEIISNISRNIETSCMSFVTKQMEGTHYFLPTYRYDAQILDTYDKPERVLLREKNRYIIVDYLSQIGKELGVDLVLVDLRAGVSEYSAPFLFDPRVTKFLVTSTSFQSAFGTRMILNQMEKQPSWKNSDINIILNMVPEVFEKEARDVIYDLLLDLDKENGSQDDDESLSDYITEIPANNSLLHLGNIEQICKQLNIADSFSSRIRKIVATKFYGEDVEVEKVQDKGDYVATLHELASKELTAEGNNASAMLTTKALKAIGTNFKWKLPKIVVLGMKGSGKTYLYKQLLHAKKWNTFIEHLGEKSEFQEDVLIYPFISTEKRSEFIDLIKESMKVCSDEIPSISKSIREQIAILDLLKLKREEALNEVEWDQIWKILILKVFQNEYESLEDIDEYLQSIHKKVVFIVDGLEDVFLDYEKNETQRNAIRSICVNLINRLSELDYENIGIVTFLRKDIAQLSITPNFEQFANQYFQYELKWSQTDALRLALWLANRAKNSKTDFSVRTVAGEDVPIENASRDIIEEALYELWGRKMGTDNSKTAITSRWVLASLSDFNGQLQARDIVRFLKHSTSDYQKEEEKKYIDRYLSPNKMKHAIKECSEEKFNEVIQEIVQLRPIFSKLKGVNPEDKKVPLNENVLLQLSAEEKKVLTNYGYLKEVDNEWYIPESIRYALEFDKTKRGGSKLVSLLVQK